MRGRGLKILLILVDLVLIAALAGEVWALSNGKVKMRVPAALQGVEMSRFVPSRNHRYLTQADLTLVAKALSPEPVKAVEPVKGGEETASGSKEISELGDLVVIGVILDTESPSDSIAVLYDKKSGEQENLFVGDEYKGWKLVKVIDRLTVLLERDGERKEVKKADDVLALLASSSGSGGAAAAAGRPGTHRSAPASRIPSRTTPTGYRGGRSPFGTPAAGRTTRPRNIVRNINREFLRRLAKTYDKRIQEVYAKPFIVNGRSIGMKVTRIDPKSPLMTFGIQPGDIIKSWNGIPITSERQCLELAAKYRNNVNAIPQRNEVVVIRNGTEIRMTVNLR